MARNLVATFNFGDLWYARHTVPFMRQYAERVGADFLEYKQFHRSQAYPAGPSWFHVEAIFLFADQSYFQNLLLLDADQLVLPSCPNLFEGMTSRLRVVRDMGYPNVEDRFIQWCQRNYGASPRAGEYFNAGLLAIPLEAARRLCAHLGGPYPDPRDGFVDQDFLNLRISRYESLEWLPVEFNWLAPQFQEAALTKHIVHCVGRHKQLLPELIHRLQQP